MEQSKPSAGSETLTYRIVGHAIDQSPVTRPLLGVIVVAALACLFDAGDAYLVGFAIPGIAKDFHLGPQAIGCDRLFHFGWHDRWIIFLGMDCRQAGPQARLYRHYSDVLPVLGGLRFSLFGRLSSRCTFPDRVGNRRFGTRRWHHSGRVRSSSHTRLFRIGAMPIAFPVGLFLASATALVVLPRWGWRGLFFVGVVPALLTVWVRRNVPESPRWLANRGRFAEARKALHYLQISDEAIERSRIAVQKEPPVPMLPPAVYP